MPDNPLRHAFANQLAIIIGFCDLLLGELPSDDPARTRIAEIRTNAHAAVALLPRVIPDPPGRPLPPA